MLTPLERELLLGLARGALQPQDDLLGGLRLLVEDGLGLTTVTRLLAVVSSLSLREGRGLAGLVLCDLVDLVLVALTALAEGLSCLRNVDHLCGVVRVAGTCGLMLLIEGDDNFRRSMVDFAGNCGMSGVT